MAVDAAKTSVSSVLAAGLMAGVVWCFGADLAAAHPKTDMIVLANGDTITGEIKKMERGKLDLKTDAMSTVSIKWNDITGLTSEYYYEFEDRDGYKYYGTPRLEAGVFRIFVPAAVVTFEKDQIVRITPIEEELWNRLKGSVSLGTSYTRGTEVGKLDFSGDIRYTGERNYLSLSLSASYTSQEDRPTSRRNEGVLTYQRAFQRRFFAGLTGTVFRSDDQGVALRTTLGAGFGIKIIQSNSHLLVGSLGASINREWAVADSVPATNNVEGVVSTEYSIFKYDSPKTDLTVSADVFPRLPGFDRIRFDFEVRLRQELITDFFVELRVYNNYDSDPPSEGALKNDWGVVASLGYSY
jgi:putative salt-induced outer membrane protein YdiY